MSDAKTVVLRIFDEGINQGRMDALPELFADDFVDHGPTGDMKGRDVFAQMVEQWRSAVPDVHCTVENLFVEGDNVGWLVRTTDTHTGDGLGFPATGRTFETLSANIGLFRDGKAAEHWAEQGMFPLLVQIGVIPLPALA